MALHDDQVVGPANFPHLSSSLPTSLCSPGHTSPLIEHMNLYLQLLGAHRMFPNVLSRSCVHNCATLWMVVARKLQIMRVSDLTATRVSVQFRRRVSCSLCAFLRSTGRAKQDKRRRPSHPTSTALRRIRTVRKRVESHRGSVRRAHRAPHKHTPQSTEQCRAPQSGLHWCQTFVTPVPGIPR